MNRKLVLAPALLCTWMSACTNDAGDDEARPAWDDINVIRENTEEPRAHFIPYRNAEDALAGNVDSNPWFLSLNGAWKFHYADSPAERPANFQETDFDASGWVSTSVPSNWERDVEAAVDAGTGLLSSLQLGGREKEELC